jgi:kinesin family protein 5
MFYIALSLFTQDARRGTYIEGCSSYRCCSLEDCLRYLKAGCENRSVASTAMNASSSRSHACVVISIEKRERKGNNKKENNKSMGERHDSKVIFGKLFFVDLAGSERVGKSQVYGKHFNELKSINLSLSALGNCVAALSEKHSHVPYRDSKLTRLLSDSLGGNSKTSLILTINPSESEYFETLQSITFGQVFIL